MSEASFTTTCPRRVVFLIALSLNGNGTASLLWLISNKEIWLFDFNLLCKKSVYINHRLGFWYRLIITIIIHFICKALVTRVYPGFIRVLQISIFFNRANEKSEHALKVFCQIIFGVILGYLN